jgi:hypothetical protein
MGVRGVRPRQPGRQTAFLQGGNAQLSQTVNLATGTYSVTFMARRPYQGNAQPVQFSVDGVNIGTPISPASTVVGAHDGHYRGDRRPPAALHVRNPSGDNTIRRRGDGNTSGTPAAPRQHSRVPSERRSRYGVTFTATVTGSALTTSDSRRMASRSPVTAIPLSGRECPAAMCSTATTIGTRRIVPPTAAMRNLGLPVRRWRRHRPASGPALANPGFERRH